MLKLAAIFVVALLSSGNNHSVIGIDAPQSVKQGGVVKIFIRGYGPHDIQFDYPNGSKVLKIGTFDVDDNLHFAIIPISVDESAGQGLLTVYSSSNARSIKIEIRKNDFPVASGIDVVHELVGIKKVIREIERAEMDNVYANIIPVRYWNKDLKFAEPLADMAVTSPFGKIRRKIFIPKKGKAVRYDRPHYGVDLRADIGTAVFAPEAGIVRIAKYFSAEGNFVVLDHGFGVLTLYMHLSKIKVKPGQEVKRGEVIALTGQTAAKNNPHLHFEVRIRNTAVSPFELMPEPPQAGQKQRGGK